jgi:hypothetical protein
LQNKKNKNDMIMKTKMKGWQMLVVLIASAVTLAACSKNPLENLTAEESRIYITNYDSLADFSSYQTFSISDSVTVINNGQANKQSTSVDRAFIDAAKSQMMAQGFTLVDKNANPDLAINISRIYNSSTGIISYNNYWNNYNGYYDPYYWGFPGYGYYSPYSFRTYTIREGALSIDLLDLKNASVNNQIKGIWSGLIRGSGIFDANTAASQVQQLFAQSPYIQTK